MGLIKDAIVVINRSILGEFLLSAFRHIKQTSKYDKVIPKQSGSINLNPDDGDDPGSPPPPPPDKSR